MTLDNSRSNSASVSVSSVSPASSASSASPASPDSPAFSGPTGSMGSVDSVDSAVEVDTCSYRDSGYVSSGLAFRYVYPVRFAAQERRRQMRRVHDVVVRMLLRPGDRFVTHELH